ncbi:diguanylate cyclase [Thermoanaerobacterium thermosaccharolyticum]|jgi:oligopeptide transport system permease protein|uniref:Binding-protein-dependent transport systems inner membrane component n=3 Tax=Thermoanaerobacterium thermosaccharolyticum TaxID=1517 RepID=D9TQM6_THETC|nr:ABC transporter permease [Thermoanaerobacterium thermosaccharolyticum]TCW42108.1 oligopeptide transport system permease protein [Thermohydrogenium kirishiense]ADL69562.1 binding-protein-dependent transport systems inner membrane component [Thermoanaerobacterium thermosaccharolyticum DSM 571]AGB19736.1 ABC-type dipeptide/oligopeptide/nickel transport system, permease component [Thermoanaerobacterium thermosaccharolyticum M0795]AST56718.1 diguanylate cyclase [Thermoanaerobacterium thermosaccha
MVDISKDKFEIIGANASESQSIVRPSISYWQDAWRRLKMNKVAMASLVFLILLVLMAIFGPYMRPFDYAHQDLLNTNKPFSKVHWFGTDYLGRDLFVRVWMGARVSLFIGVVIALLDAIIGVTYGGIAGYFGGQVDNIMMRIVDILYGIPYLILVILLMVVMGQGLWTIITAMVMTGWVGMARIVRGQVLQLKEQEFVLAAKTLGASPGRIILRHLIPNALGPIIVSMTFDVPNAIFSEAFLSYIGLGIRAPLASWGTLANDATQVLLMYPMQLFIPGFFISITMLAFNMLGDGLRDALDPRLRR